MVTVALYVKIISTLEMSHPSVNFVLLPFF
jgi:hypothetical protein